MSAAKTASTTATALRLHPGVSPRDNLHKRELLRSKTCLWLWQLGYLLPHRFGERLLCYGSKWMLST